MPLSKVQFQPGFNKQATATEADGQWIDGDFVRFRYGMPEKIGGWEQLQAKTLVGAARAQHSWVDLAGNKYAVIGTNRLLALYYDNTFYDITPIDPDRQSTGANITTTNGSTTVTVTTSGAHNLAAEDLITFENAGSFNAGQTSYTAANFDDIIYEVQSVPTTTTFTITMGSAETGSGTTNNGTLDPLPYIQIGNLITTSALGWGAGAWGQSTWGTPRASSNVIIDPGSWSLDNYGHVLIATVHNGRTFQWNPISANAVALTTRAVALASNPTKSVMTVVSDRDRHLIHLGTETTIGNTTTQDKMFIRFSDQEDPNDYAPTSTNTAGTFRIDSGTRIVGAVKGKDYLLILTDTSAYVMQFVGTPFTFSIRQVGSNCGLFGQHAAVYVDGAVYWMSEEGGFFVYDGTVKTLPCTVEDFVYTTSGDNLGISFFNGEQIFAGHNSLYSEINWFYPKSGGNFVDRLVTYNYAERVWTTGSLARTTYSDTSVFAFPYATEFTQNSAPTFPTVLGISASQGKTTYYAQEIGVNQKDSSGTETKIAAFIQSGDFDLEIGGEGEYMMKIRRFIPDFKLITGNAKVTLNLRDFPSETKASSPLGPFTVTSATKKVDTRARARLASLKVENDAVNESWRMGTFRFDTQPDGRR